MTSVGDLEALLLHPGSKASTPPEVLQGHETLVYTVDALPGPSMADSAGTLFESLLSIMSRLRSEGGCPWDREQTRESLKPYLIEEAYETLEAIDSGAAGPLREELGDLLFQVIFHAQLGDERREFTMEDVLRHLIDKMIGRHPHVFGDASV